MTLLSALSAALLLAAAAGSAPRGGAAAIDGARLALRSIGHAAGAAWVLDASGFVGTYLRVDRAGPVTVSARTLGPAGPCRPRVVLAIGDERVGFGVAAGDGSYRYAFKLAAGTHLLRVELPSSNCGGALTIAGVEVWGATPVNEASDANALAAADAYIRNGRRGTARLRIDGLPQATPVHVRLKRHTFQLGINIPGTFNRFLIEGAAPDSEAGRFQRFVLDHFNTVVPSNGGKWLYHEGTRDFVTMEYVDLILRWAARHDLRARMHTLIWDTEQQPVWVADLLTAAAAGDAAAKADLVRAIERRVVYSVRDRGAGYQEIDVLNESLHHPRYLDVLGNGGLAAVFNQVARAAPVRGFLNEYNVLQGSRHPQKGKTAPLDPYANWYRRHVEDVRAAGGEVGGVGVQYYADARSGIETPHGPARIHQALTNLSATGLPVVLTEFGVKKGASRAEAARILDETMRMVFGTPGTSGFLMFGFWAGAIWDTAPEAVLVDGDWKLTEAGAAYEKLMAAWSTDVTVPVAADGTIEFTGFHGDYVVEVPGKTFTFELVKGKTAYELR
jgi:GH35 family endo-1,4-beta-xylanase